MNKKIWISLGIIVILVAVLIARSKGGGEAGMIRIGAISILTGDYAAVGENAKNGIILAAEEYNAKHPERPVELTIEDDNFNTLKGVSAYRKLTGVDNIEGLINLSSPTIDGIYDDVVKNGMPVIQGGEQGRDNEDDNVFQITPGTLPEERGFGAELSKRGYNHIALFTLQNSTMLRFSGAFKEGYEGKFTEYILSGKTDDYRTLATKAISEKPDIFVLFEIPEDGARLVKEIQNQDPNAKFAFDPDFQAGIKDYDRIIGLDKLEGALVSTVKNTVTDEFSKNYKARFGVEPGIFSDYAYDGFNILLETYNKDKKVWVENIKKIKYKGVGGITEFDEVGVRKPDYMMSKVQGGKLVEDK